ncbi:RPS10 [Auxenochlorella protothecoides x Auxenochlorella symbiontica]
MLISKKNRRAVYKQLFNDGVMYAEKDFNLKQHPEKDLEGVSNLEVIKLLQSLRSKELVTERYAWRHFYWFLTDSGIEYLREYLNLTAPVSAATGPTASVAATAAATAPTRPVPPASTAPSSAPAASAAAAAAPLPRPPSECVALL